MPATTNTSYHPFLVTLVENILLIRSVILSVVEQKVAAKLQKSPNILQNFMINHPPKIVKGRSSSMDQAFIPSEIIINILSRLPVRTIIRCKCVCKSWLELLETPEFAQNHLSKSTPGLIVYNGVFKIFKFVDELELEHRDLRYNLVIEYEKTRFTSTPPHDATGVVGSVNGLVLLCGSRPDALYVCNPITGEYIELPCLEQCKDSTLVTYGFGVSVKSGQYKVVRILQECVRDENNGLLRISKTGFWVYTLGTRAWRSIAPCPFFDCDDYAFLNGNLHWLVEDINVNGSYLISCFNLETEVFSTFSPPPRPGILSLRSYPVVFEDYLCICDSSTGSDNEIVIWVMKEYGNENSWMKQFVFTKDPVLHCQSLAYVEPLKLFKDGVILLLWGPFFLSYCCSNKINTAQKLDLFENHENRFIEARLHVSSFISLRSFAMATVRKF